MRLTRALTALAVSATLALTAAALAGCGPDTGPRVVLKTAHSSAGTVVVDAAGRAVYLYSGDQQNAKSTSCDAACRASWPPVTTISTQPKGDGVDAAVGEIPAPDGGYQVTLDGWPLYYFDGDTTAGMIKGQGIGNVWWLLAPDGQKITAIGR
ncbi:COG4315 family predicted lipoprotein [Microbacterium terrisoli]|jgi:predicted lipoprotein with Yx(FWY)xxD motif|uniref:COG4315 family predicted lipoprotein n=1 Tax=Microbacterium terrisoli TaxID=3242192 RepID=UPI002805CE76|nr:hypothetical protein [Microbacterium protaetiae]